MANKIKKISLEESGNIIHVIMSSYMIEDQEILMRSSDQFNLPYIMIGLCQEWRGLGDKILRVRDMLRLMYSGGAKQLGFDPSRFKDTYIQFTDAWDVLVVNQPKKLESTYVSQFNKNSIVFMGETACWPDESLKSSFPETTSDFKYLNSGVFFGPASRILHLYEDYPVASYDYDDQLYYIKALFTNNYNIVIDYKKQMFGSLHGNSNFEDIYEIETNSNGEYRLISKVYDNKSKQYYRAYPVLVHGHGPIAGPSKNHLRFLQNFFPSTKTKKAPYLSLPPLPSTESNGKKVLLSLFLYSDQPFFEMFIEGILSFEHKKEDIVLYVNYFAGNDSNPLIEKWLNKTDKLGYHKVVKTFEENIREAKVSALKATVTENCDFYFTTDALITKKDILSNLIAEDKAVVFPMITRYNSIYSNFWGAFHFDSGYYKRHALYKQIANYEVKGIFGISVAWGSFLLKASHAEKFSTYYLDEPEKNNKPLREMYKRSEANSWWLDIYFSVKISVDRPVYVTNREHFGYLIERIPEEKSKGRLHKELYAYEDSSYLWKQYYYSEEFFNYIFKNQPLNYTEACDDVFVWQFFKPVFGVHLYEEAEHFGEWSGGGHKEQTDPRIGGVEHYPTQDIHLNQFGLHETWLDIIKTDIAKFAAELYSDTTTKGINIAFIVRYKPGAQSFLRPHHDSSLYTVAVALNKPGRDFQGGGVRFVRRNCTYIPPESGFSLIHPGRVTHRHEGLETTHGTRYIFVTFVE